MRDDAMIRGSGAFIVSFEEGKLRKPEKNASWILLDNDCLPRISAAPLMMHGGDPFLVVRISN